MKSLKVLAAASLVTGSALVFTALADVNSARAQEPGQGLRPGNALPPAEPIDGIEAQRCMVQYINKTMLPAESQGKLIKLNFEEGDSVKAGTVLAVIDDKQADLALKLKQAEEREAKLNADNDINFEDAVASQAIAESEALSWEELLEKGAAPVHEVKKKRLEADRAKLRIKLSLLQQATAKAVHQAKQYETKLAQMDIDMRQVKADFDAFVEKRIAQHGEWVQPGSPIAELVQMDWLRVEGDFDALANSGLVAIGTPVLVRIITGYDISGRPQVVEINAVINYVSTEVNANDQYRVWTKIQNRRVGDDWMVKPGMHAEMIIRRPGNPAP